MSEITLCAFSNYREYLRARIRSMPHRGRGQLKKMAALLGVSPPYITQVLQGRAEFNTDQACVLARHLGLSSQETEILVDWVALERANLPALKELIQKRV